MGVAPVVGHHHVVLVMCHNPTHVPATHATPAVVTMDVEDPAAAPAVELAAVVGHTAQEGLIAPAQDKQQ